MTNLVLLRILFLICFLAETTRGQLSGFGLQNRFWERNQLNNLMVTSPGIAAVPIDRWFTQKLDHFDAFNNKTWQQVNKDLKKEK